ncbi:hypothetical protein BKA62DRAFT_164821 [Auriculariales sp. MPI-PUGE-AT-0066]|nr:hypothetical protein BKA62DRAFT_164821 [Auriculariales sp. MPI-PUGE-AT-0066]
MHIYFDPDVDSDPSHGTKSPDPDGLDEDHDPFGTLFLTSSKEESVSDMGDQSDWVLESCDSSHTKRQSVVAYCSKDIKGSQCSHVLLGGAEHTIIKMPSDCGRGPIARIHALELHPNPPKLKLSKLGQAVTKPDSEAVYQLTFDYEFNEVPEDNGPIYFRSDVTDMPGYWDEIIDDEEGPTSDPQPTAGASDPKARRFEHRAHRRAKRAAAVARLGRRGWFSRFTSWLQRVNTVSQRVDHVRRYYWDQDIDIFSASAQCENNNTGAAYTTNLTATLHGQTTFDWKYGLFVEGTLVPPSLSRSYIYFDNNMDHVATFTLAGKASVEWNSDRMTLLNVGFPGLTVPGIITVGPSLKVQGYISGEVDIEGSIQTTLQYTFPPMQFAIGDGTNVQRTNLTNPSMPPVGSSQPSLTAEVALSANAKLHIVPRLQLGISILNGAAMNAQAYVEADLYAGLAANSSISTDHPLEFCLRPFGGLDINLGLEGSVLFIQGEVGPWTVYSREFTIYEQCWHPTAKRDLIAGGHLNMPDHPLASLSSLPLPVGKHMSARRVSSLERRFNLPGLLGCPPSV